MFDEVIVQFELDKPLVKVAGVPPEEMRLDRYARSFHDSRIVGHERVVPDRSDGCDGLRPPRSASTICNRRTSTSSRWRRRSGNPGRAMSTRVGDGVKYGEWYVRADQNGDGRAMELRYICTMGEDRKIVHDEEANRIKFALFSPDPISHTIVGDSITDYTLDIQRIKTNMMRGVLDSLAESINPKTVINELMVNMDDAMNDDLGAVIRTRGDPSAAVMYTNTPFVGQPAMEVIALAERHADAAHGVERCGEGFGPQGDPEFDADWRRGRDQRRAGAGRAGGAHVVRNFGFIDLFKGIFCEICENPNPVRMLRMSGKFVAFDPSTFDANMSVEVNPNLGKGNDMVRMMALVRHQAGSARLWSRRWGWTTRSAAPSRC